MAKKDAFSVSLWRVAFPVFLFMLDGFGNIKKYKKVLEDFSPGE